MNRSANGPVGANIPDRYTHVQIVWSVRKHYISPPFGVLAPAVLVGDNQNNGYPHTVYSFVLDFVDI